MATFTMRLKDVIELTDGDIGLNEYPIFDEAYREKLNKKIVDHYLNQEIGQETIDMWRHAVKRHMNEIMPYYNQLYKSELLQVEPFLTFSSDSSSTTDAEHTTSSDTTSNAASESGSTSTSRTVASEMPQVRLEGDADYATAAQDAISESGATSNAQDSSHAEQGGEQSQTTQSTGSGFSGSMSSLLMEYRQTFLNIDMMVIEDMRDLFMLVWNTGDEYSGDRSPFLFPHWGWW